MNDNNKAVGIFTRITSEQMDAILDAVDAAVDIDLKGARADGMSDEGLLVAEWLSRASTRVVNLAKHMQVEPDKLYAAMMSQGLVMIAVDILTTFAPPTSEDYSKFAMAIAQDFNDEFAKAAASMIRNHTKVN